MFKANLSSDLCQSPQHKIDWDYSGWYIFSKQSTVVRNKGSERERASCTRRESVRHQIEGDSLLSEDWFFGKRPILCSGICGNLWQIYISEHLFLHILFLSAYGKNKQDLFLFACISSFAFGILMEWDLVPFCMYKNLIIFSGAFVFKKYQLCFVSNSASDYKAIYVKRN